MGPWPPSVRCSRPSPSASRPVTSGCTRSSGTACGCLPTCAAGRVLGVVAQRARRDGEPSPSSPPSASAYDDMLLDGEVVALEGGRPSFGALAERMHVRDRRQAEQLAGVAPGDLHGLRPAAAVRRRPTAQPLSARRELLDRLDLAGPALAGAARLRRRRASCFAATLEQGLEGVVSKRRSSPYLPGRRSKDWLKSPHRSTVSAVVGGWRPEKTNDSGRLGAVLLGVPDGAGGWRFAGRMGSGIAGTRRAASSSRPCAGSPADRLALQRRGARGSTASGATWVEPRRRRRGAHPRGDPRRPAAPAGIPRHPHRPDPRRPPGGGRCLSATPTRR